MIAFLIHVLCSCVAFVCRLLGRYRHVGEKRPPGAHHPGVTTFNPRCEKCVNPEGRYVDRYGLIGAGLTDGGLDGFVSRWLGVNVWLQRIWRADGDRHMHDHPWHVAGSLILTGGHDEQRAAHADHGPSDPRRPARVNLLPAGVYHRITAVRPRTWTLFITGRPHGRGWGFLVGGQHVPAAAYLGDSFYRGQTKRRTWFPEGTRVGVAQRALRKGELCTDKDVKFLSDQLATVADKFARTEDLRDRDAIELMVGGYQITPLQQETATEFERELMLHAGMARMARDLDIPITDEIPDTLRNDGQPDTEREPTTRRKDGAS